MTGADDDAKVVGTIRSTWAAPAREAPQCLLRVARFRGLDRSEFLDNRQFNGNAFTLLSSAERFLRDTLPIASRFESGRMARIDEPLYPPLATREALANALCHRDYAMGGGSIGLAVYDDRLEVTSTGPLHFGLTPNDLFGPHESRPWNPLIARAFYRRGIIEEWGRGTIRMADLATSAGLPRPEIEERSDCVTVRFRRADYVAPLPAGNDLMERRRAILAILDRAEDGLPLREIHARLRTVIDTTLPTGATVQARDSGARARERGNLVSVTVLTSQASERQVRRALAELRKRALAESFGRGPASRWKRVRPRKNE